MTKKLILFFAVLIFLLMAWREYKSEPSVAISGLRPEMFAGAIRAQAAGKGQSYYPPEEEVGTRTFIETLPLADGQTLILLSEEWLSGSGGDGGAIVVTDSRGEKTKLVGWFTNYMTESLKLSADSKKVVFTQLDYSGLCLGRTYRIIRPSEYTVEDIVMANQPTDTMKIPLDQYDFQAAKWTSAYSLRVQLPLQVCVQSPSEIIEVSETEINI